MRLTAKTAYEAWQKLNHVFLADDSGSMIMPGRDFSHAKYNVQLRVTNGFGLPDDPPPFFNMERRLKTLETRYIDPDLWKEGVERLLARRDRATGTYPNTFLVQFHRRETRERKVPAGGGCLVSLNFTWFKKRWHLHVLSRASEITARLLADMYFVERAVNRVIEEAQVRKWDPDNLIIDWTLLLPSQMKYMVPIFLLFVEGEEAIKSMMVDPPLNDWHKIVQEHFWKEFIFPEKIKWAQRRKWSEKFLTWTGGRDKWLEVGESHDVSYLH